MDHTQAVRAKALEAYLLGDLSHTDRREFEEHFFDCQECANGLSEGATFIDTYKQLPEANLRADASRQMALVAPRRSGGLRSVYALAASAVLAAVLLYQNAVTIPKLRQSAAPQALESFSLESTGSRGFGAAVLAPAPGKPFVILFDIPPGAGEKEYTCDIRSESGALATSFRVSATLAQRTIPVFIPSSELAPGKYALVIRGDQQTGKEGGEAIAHYPFEIR